MRTAAVERAARVKLDRLTSKLDHTPAQGDKMFPLIVRSTPGYDPVMLVVGNLASRSAVAAAGKTQQVIASQQQVPAATTTLTARTAVAVAEEIHQILDPQQQVLVEDQEVNRQLWWQDTLTRLEADLIDSTGGGTSTIAMTPADTATTPESAAPADAGREAPDARESSNLFDLLDTNQ